MPKTAIERLAQFIVETPKTAHPAKAIERAQFAMLDTLGCLLLGAHSEVAEIATQASCEWGKGATPVIGRKTGLPAPWAALVNGAAAHALDLDDYTFVANDHPSAVLIPALLAASHGRKHEFSGMDLLDAYLIGLEVIFRLGKAVNMGHYKLGWHTTSTLDSLGASAAVCRLRGLNAGQTAAALSLTTSMGSGYVSQFGTSGKPLHAGFSAKTGLVAAGLGAAGASGQLAALDGPVSFASLLVPEGEANFDNALVDLGQNWGIEEFGLGAKVYPSCGYTHRAVDAAIAVRAELGIQNAAEIKHVAVSLPDFHLAVLPYHVPQDRTEALFSTAFCVATALLTGDNRIEDFSPEAIQEPTVLSLVERIEVTGRVPQRPILNFDEDDPDSVEVELLDGRRARYEVPVYTGAPGRDLSREQFQAKFADCYQHYLNAGGSESIKVGAMIEATESLAVSSDLSGLWKALKC